MDCSMLSDVTACASALSVSAMRLTLMLLPERDARLERAFVKSTASSDAVPAAVPMPRTLMVPSSGSPRASSHEERSIAIRSRIAAQVSFTFFVMTK